MSRKGIIINNTQIIPSDYIPTENIVLCGNKISNYKYLISDNGFYPILIGEGELPRIWIYVREKKDEYITLVEDSVSNVNRIKIDIRNSEKKIEIKETLNNIIILKLDYSGILTVKYLNLEPIGYFIHGDETKLSIGNSTINGNTFTNVPTVIGLGPRGK